MAQRRSIMERKAVVVGATGLVGGYVVRELLVQRNTTASWLWADVRWTSSIPSWNRRSSIGNSHRKRRSPSKGWMMFFAALGQR